MRNVTSAAVLGLCVAVLMSAGCSAFRKEWPSKRMAREYTPAPERPTVMAPSAEADAFTYPALETLPAGVQASFTRDNPSAAIVAVEQIPSGAGPMLYRVTSLQNGMPTSVTYRSTGAELNPAEVVIYRQNDDYRPKAKFASQPEAGIPAKGTPTGSID